jgi:hypothetical protein
MHRRSILGLGFSSFFLPSAEAQNKPLASSLSVRDFGAKADGKTNDTGAIQKAINTANANGGGIAYVPPGTYLAAGIEIRSNVTLYLEAGAKILGSTNLSDYRPLAGPRPNADANDKHLIFAHRAENIGLAGPGVVDGQGQHFWVPKNRPKVADEDLWRDVATYDWKPVERPSPMVEIVECRNVRIEGVTLKNSPGWTLRPIGCDSVFIRGISIRNPIYGPNCDGIDPTCCQNVFISDCDIATADDTICLKSENPYGEVRVSKNITITNCVLTGCCNGLKMGTSTRGGFENITFSNSVIYNDDVPLNQRVIAGIAIEMVDGGWVDGVVISNIRMRNVRTPIFVRLGNRGGGQRPPVPGRLQNVMISNIDATGAILTSSITGIPGHLAERITLSDIQIETEEGGQAEWNKLDVPEQERSYPEARMFGRLPSYGLYCRHASGVRLSNVRVTSKVPDPRPLLTCDDVEHLELNGIGGTSAGPGQALLDLRNARNVFVHGCIAPPETAVFCRIAGEGSQGVTLLGNELSQAGKAVEALGGASEREIHLESNRVRSA